MACSQWAGHRETPQRREHVSRRFIVIAAAIALLVLTGSAGAVAAGRHASTSSVGGNLRFGTDFNYPPMEYFKSGKQAGFDTVFAPLLAKRLGMTAVFVPTEFASLIPSLQSGKFDVILSSLFMTSARAKVVRFIPYLTTGNVIVARKSDESLFKKPRDLCGHTVAVQQGGFNETISIAGGDLAKQCGSNAMTVKSFPTETQAYLEIKAGRADATIDSSEVAHYVLSRNPSWGLAVTSPPGKLYYRVPVGMAVKASDVQLAAKLSAAVKYLERTGQLAKLLKPLGLNVRDPALVRSVLRGTK